jgi:hypothetical protein
VRAIELKVDHFCRTNSNYAKFKDEITPKIYIEKVKKKKYDPVLSFQLSNDFHELRVPKLFIRDAESLEFAVLLNGTIFTMMIAKINQHH